MISTTARALNMLMETLMAQLGDGFGLPDLVADGAPDENKFTRF